MRVLCFGDSNTYGYDPCSFFGGRYPAESRWTDILARETGWEVLGAGENGREIPRREGELRRFRELVVETRPDVLVVLLGGNDLLQGAAPAEAVSRMETLVRQPLGLEPEQILLIGPPPVALGAWVPSEQLVRDSVALAQGYRHLAEALGIAYADAGEWGVELTYDGVHYSEKGHASFARGLRRALETLSKHPGEEERT